MKFKSLLELLDYFKDEKTCIEYFENIRWDGNPACPHCKFENPYKTNRGWKCSNKKCYKKFTVRIGTIFENSNLGFRKWFAAIFLATSHKKGISSLQLASDLNISQSTAWFMLHRIREMLKYESVNLFDSDKVIEADETLIGGKEGKKHIKKRKDPDNPLYRNDGKRYKEKSVVIGLIQRDGKVALKYLKDPLQAEVHKFIEANTPKGSTIYTDESTLYSRLKMHYTHKTVKHKVDMYVAGNVHTNTIESFWALLKRGLVGIYHQVSDKHLERYLNEFASRYNARALDHQSRIEGFLRNSEKYLSYKRLIA